jgi:hypothetical protein
MKNIRNVGIIIAVAAILAACAQITLLKPGNVVINDVFTVDTTINWNRLPPANGRESWTLDGVDLQIITFNTKVEVGENLVRKTGSDEGPDAKFKTMPKFKKGMNALDISEMYVATFAQFGNSYVRASATRKASFGGRDGFYFELDYVDKEGLERRAIVQGAIQADLLHAILYAAPKLHYFGRDLDRAKAIIRSVRFLPGAAA